MNNYTIKRFSSKEELAKEASKIISQHISFCLTEKNRIQISLCGGSTPTNTYKILSKENIEWERVDLFLGDERWVDLSNELSNSLMIKNTFSFNSQVSKPSFHFVPTTQFESPQKSAEEYEKILKKYCNSNSYLFDLMLLGLGEDGHTASLFPYSSSINVIDRLTTVGEGKGNQRISLTHPALSSAKKIIFLISGSSKKTSLKRLLDPTESSERTPAKLVKSSHEILILADYAACEFI
tara:strand:- start:74 stop:787 length:714 start_codon:yes stop_codon:yes gene_type:complete